MNEPQRKQSFRVRKDDVFTAQPLTKEDVFTAFMYNDTEIDAVKLSELLSALKGLREELEIEAEKKANNLEYAEMSGMNFAESLVDKWFPILQTDSLRTQNQSDFAVLQSLVPEGSSSLPSNQTVSEPEQVVGGSEQTSIFSRVEIINGVRRIYVSYEQHSISIQDNGRTLKLFTNPIQLLSQPSNSGVIRVCTGLTNSEKSEGSTRVADAGELKTENQTSFHACPSPKHSPRKRRGKKQ